MSKRNLRMHYRKLREMATPGVLIPMHGKGTCFHEGNLDSLQRAAGRDGGEELWETVAELWPTIDKEQARADTALIAHHWRYFTELLDALEWVTRCPTMPGPAGIKPVCVSEERMQEFKELINTASIVEGA
jgi:hypothetical protein